LDVFEGKYVSPQTCQAISSYSSTPYKTEKFPKRELKVIKGKLSDPFEQIHAPDEGGK
jgi:hypothetical protein